MYPHGLGNLEIFTQDSLNLLSKPGLWFQKFTTKEPDEDMIEVAIASVEAVFDWKPYVEKVRGEGAAEAD